MKQKSKELKDEMYEWLLSEIRAAQVTGVPVAVDGKIYSLLPLEQEVMAQAAYSFNAGGIRPGSFRAILGVCLKILSLLFAPLGET